MLQTKQMAIKAVAEYKNAIFEKENLRINLREELREGLRVEPLEERVRTMSIRCSPYFL
jgi:hypothetical protein